MAGYRNSKLLLDAIDRTGGAPEEGSILSQMTGSGFLDKIGILPEFAAAHRDWTKAVEEEDKAKAKTLKSKLDKMFDEKRAIQGHQWATYLMTQVVPLDLVAPPVPWAIASYLGLCAASDIIYKNNQQSVVDSPKYYGPLRDLVASLGVGADEPYSTQLGIAGNFVFDSLTKAEMYTPEDGRMAKEIFASYLDLLDDYDYFVFMGEQNQMIKPNRDQPAILQKWMRERAAYDYKPFTEETPKRNPQEGIDQDTVNKWESRILEKLGKANQK
jgi:hypothetical protein